MSIKGLDNVINKLKLIRNSSVKIDTLFISKSLDWISQEANKILDGRTNHFWGSDARLWTKRIYATYGILENQDMNSASIEFGIGRIGELSPNINALENGYVYNKPSQYKDDNGYWTFKDARTGIWLTINGYTGKSFLYDAFCNYMFGEWQRIYQEAFNEIIGGICK